jgi:hypothetical protein
MKIFDIYQFIDGLSLGTPFSKWASSISGFYMLHSFADYSAKVDVAVAELENKSKEDIVLKVRSRQIAALKELIDLIESDIEKLGKL